jgi:hypothetical protein
MTGGQRTQKNDKDKTQDALHSRKLLFRHRFPKIMTFMKTSFSFDVFWCEKGAQYLPSAFGGDLLIEELGVCVSCGGGVLDWGLLVDDGARSGEVAGWAYGGVSVEALR